MDPTTGLVVDGFSDRKPTEADKELGKWAASRGLFLVIANDYDGLGIEEFDGQQLFIYELALPTQRTIWPEALDHYEKLLRAGIEREKEKHARFKWWEYVGPDGREEQPLDPERADTIPP